MSNFKRAGNDCWCSRQLILHPVVKLFFRYSAYQKIQMAKNWQGWHHSLLPCQLFKNNHLLKNLQYRVLVYIVAYEDGKTQSLEPICCKKRQNIVPDRLVWVWHPTSNTCRNVCFILFSARLNKANWWKFYWWNCWNWERSCRETYSAFVPCRGCCG